MRNWQGLKDGRLDGVRIGLPIVRLFKAWATWKLNTDGVVHNRRLHSHHISRHSI